MLLFVAALAAASVGCKRRAAPEVSQTQTTAVDVDLDQFAAEGGGQDPGLRAMRETAKNDLANLDRRVAILEERADSKGMSDQVSTELAEARRRMELLSREVDALQTNDWEARREDLDRGWDEVSLLVETVGEALTDAPQ